MAERLDEIRASVAVDGTARNHDALPWLIAEVVRLREALAAAEAALKRIVGHGTTHKPNTPNPHPHASLITTRDAAAQIAFDALAAVAVASDGERRDD